MRFLKGDLLVLLIVALPAGVAAQTPTNQASAWREDLRTLSENLVRFHPNAFHKTPQSDFENAVSALDQRIPLLADTDVAVEFSRIAALIGDAHTNVYLAQAPGLRRYPLRLRWFSDGLFVTDATPGVAAALGRQLRKINGVDIGDVMDRIRGIISHENSQWLRHVAEDYLVIPEVLYNARIVDYSGAARFEFGDEAGGTVAIDILPLQSLSGVEWIRHPSPDDVPAPLYLRDPGLDYWVRYLSASRTVFFKYNVCRESPGLPMSEVFAQIFNLVDTRTIDRLIVDMRGNGGGNSSLLRPLISGLQVRAINGRFNAATQLYGIIDSGSFSAAVDNAATIRVVSGTLVGEPTGGKPNGYGEVLNSGSTLRTRKAGISARECCRSSPANRRRAF